MARRLRIIVFYPPPRLQRLSNSKQHLRRQNYSVECINDVINRAMDTHNPCNHNILKSAKRFLTKIRPIRKYEKTYKPIINHKQQKTSAESDENYLESKVLVQHYYFHQKVRPYTAG